MKHPILRTFAWIAIFMMVVSMACNLGSGTATSVPKPTETTAVRASDTPAALAAPTKKPLNTSARPKTPRRLAAAGRLRAW